MKPFTYKRAVWFWNPFGGFFFLPVGPTRKRERIIREGSQLYAQLYAAAGQP